MLDIGIAPTDSTVRVSDPAKQPFVSLGVSGVACFFTEESPLMLGAGVVSASVEGVSIGFGDGVVCVEGATLDSGGVAVEGAIL
jgi:hypothetical protein